MAKLRITPHQPKTLIWWFGRRESIDFSPPYQRKGRLWSTQDKAFLIDTIINGFDVPKLYLADFQYGNSQLNSKRLAYAIIDGKQRLEAVFDFFEGTLTLSSDFVFKADPSLKLGGLSLKDLRRSYRNVADEFENASFDIMSVFAEDEKDVNELFVRLNRSKPLTGAEVRNAIAGPVTDVIRSLTEHSVFQESIRFSTLRAGDQNAAAKCLLFEYENKLVNTKKQNLDDFAKGIQIDRKRVDKNKLELSARRCLDTFDAMDEVFLPSDVMLSSAGVFPVYYWLVRSVSEIYREDIRTFLVDFEEARKQHREAQKDLGPASEVDQQYARYDTLNRSTNDAVSHRGRYAILRAAFAEYIEETYDVNTYGPVYDDEADDTDDDS
ncbi:DUF262 domain-containing protein [Sphingomonas olei]|uniref:DUF262 domain-containing protein n=1 Tax=Sphingomonas olei TaxID=1886787 RepID=A0ABY2QDT8_9SPHN|nr:DUF262 domain-containing protein [Sphingomonas olei]THG37783.1 DUF262 domain-containing protein [Sphingomonas olei]